jgi:hypothetical protein
MSSYSNIMQQPLKQLSQSALRPSIMITLKEI